MKLTIRLISVTLAICSAGVATPLFSQNTVEKEEKSYNLQEIVVTGTGTEHLLKSAPVHTEVITGKQIENFDGASLEDILSALSPSIDFSRSEMGSNMQMGGLGNSYILVLINGKRINGDTGGQNNLGVIDPARIERIEIVKGAASALYGSDAIAGVINIILKKDESRILAENTTRAGSYADIRQSNRVQFRIGNVSSETFFQLKHTDGWQNTTCEDPNRYEKPVTNSINKTVNEFTDWQAGERLDWKINRATSVYAEGSWYTKRIFRPCGVPDYKTYDFLYRDINASTGGKYAFAEKNSLTWDAMYDSHAYHYAYTGETWESTTDEDGNRFTFPYFPGDIGLQSKQERIMAQAKGIFHLPYGNCLSTGLEGRFDGLESPNRLDREYVDDYTLAAYVQDEWSPAENFNITAGARLTYNGTFGFRLSPKISAMYRAGKFTFRAGYSEGFKTPTLKELHYRYVQQMSLVILNLGNSGLKPQTSRYISAGAEFSNSWMTISATGYYNRLTNMITLVTIPVTEASGDMVITYDPARVRMYKNMDRASTAGIDASAKWIPAGWLTLTGAYSYLHTEAYMYNEETEKMEHVTIDGTANHRATVSAVWNHKWQKSGYRLSIGVYGRIQSERFYQDDGNGKAYNLWKINTRHTFSPAKNWKMEINAGIDNIFNYYETTYHGLHYGTTTPGRTWYLSVKVTFANR